MLEPDELKKQVITILKNNINTGLEAALTNHLKYDGEVEQKQVQTFVETFEKVCIEPLADGLANAINMYIKNIEIEGTFVIPKNSIVVVGNKFTQKNILPCVFKYKLVHSTPQTEIEANLAITGKDSPGTIQVNDKEASV